MKHRIYISFGKESSGDDDGVGTTEGDGQHARKISLRWVGSIWFFSGAFGSGPAGPRPLSGVGVQDLSQSVWMSQFEKGSCFLLSFSSFTQQKNTNKNAPQNQAMRCLGHRPAGFQLSQGCLAGPIFSSPTAAAAVWGQTIAHVSTAMATSLHSRLRHHCCLQFFTHHVSRPTGGIRNSKFSKQFQYFQYMLGILQWFMARRDSAPPTHRHWSISCSWHLCTLLVQLRQQL